jgi:hypothetical protein
MVSRRCYQLLGDLGYPRRCKYGQPILNRLKMPKITLISRGFFGSEEFCQARQFLNGLLGSASCLMTVVVGSGFY